MSKSSLDLLKERMREVFYQEKEITEISERIEMMRGWQEPGGAQIGLGIQSSRATDALGDLCAEILDLEAELAQSTLTLIRTDLETRRLSTYLKNDTQKAIFIWRYICRLKWPKVAERAGLSEANVMRAHAAAINTLALLY